MAVVGSVRVAQVELVIADQVELLGAVAVDDGCGTLIVGERADEGYPLAARMV